MDANSRLSGSSSRMSSRRPSRARNCGQLVVVEDVVGLVPRDVLLQQPKAVRVDRADEQAVEPIERLTSHSAVDAVDDPLLQLGRCALGERERDDGLGRDALGEQVHDPLRDDLGLPRPGRRDDLQGASAWRTASSAAPESAGAGLRCTPASTSRAYSGRLPANRNGSAQSAGGRQRSRRRVRLLVGVLGAPWVFGGSRASVRVRVEGLRRDVGLVGPDNRPGLGIRTQSLKVVRVAKGLEDAAVVEQVGEV